MKQYGIPRLPNIDTPDLVDLHTFALKSSAGNIKNKSGVIHSAFKKSKIKRACRRNWKKKTRNNNKSLCKEYE